MSRRFFDAVTASRIPATAQMVGGYVDGLYRWSAADWARFPRAVTVRIAVFATTDDGHVLDCEPGNCTPAQAVDWVLLRRRAGADPSVYCNQMDPDIGWPAVRAAFHARKVPEPHYWVAKYDGVALLPDGAVAKQYLNDESAGYDLSIVADHWPGVDPAPEADMAITDQDAQKIAELTSSLLRNTALGEQRLDGTEAGAGHTMSLGVMVAQTRARHADLGTRLDAIAAKLGALQTGGVDLAALEALIEQHLAAGSGPDAIAAAVLRHLSAATAGAAP